MKRINISKLFTALLISSVVISCNKPDDVVLANEGTVYMPQAVGSRAKMDLLFTSTNPKQDIVFGAAYGGVNFSSSNNNISFIVDAAKVLAYNIANGTSYTLLPAASYDIPSLSAVIPTGGTSCDPLTLTIKTNTVTRGIRYMLPITLSSSSNGSIDSALQTTYFRFDTLLRKSIDVTGQATFTVSVDNPGGPTANEGSLKLVDNETNTKFLFFNWPTELANNGGAWFQLKFPTAVAAEAYTFTSANDASGRDPKDWKLQGSNDGTAWTDIDTRTGELFSSRFQTRRFEVSGTLAPYTFYRIFMTANNGSTLFQMGEWRLIKYE